VRAGVVRAAADDARKRETENRAVSAYEKARADAARLARRVRRLAYRQRRLIVVRGPDGRLQVVVKRTAVDAADLVARIAAARCGRVVVVL
jgi:hypothetical protein